MKNYGFTTKIILPLLALGFALTNCSNEDSLDQNVQNEDALEVAMSSEIDDMSSVIGDIIIETFEAQEADESGRLLQQNSLPECVTVTIVAQLGFREVTVDFGDQGCLVRGHTLKGQIIFTYERDPQAQQVLINYNLVDFYFDAKNIIGSKTILRQLSNENGNPQFTHTVDLTVVWPNGAEASREGLRVREWVEGFANGIWSDNVFEITGNWTTRFVNGNTHSYEVVIPLRREMTCNYFVSGSIDVQRVNYGGVFDYGNGSCDNQATFTFSNGTVVNVTLN